MLGSFSKIPGGDVHPCRFVMLQSDNTVVECTAGANMWGISQAATRNAPLEGWDDGLAGKAGDPPINIFGPGDDAAPLELGGTVAIGDRLKAGAGGVGVVATTDKDACGAIAQQAGTAGQIIQVKPIRYDIAA